MKINLQLFFLFFAGAILLNYTTVNAQTDEEDPKLKMLEDRITRGEEKVEIARKLANIKEEIKDPVKKK